ncbi:hypothetical protein TNCV_1016151 [Trichonephila clavipes]|uniref:Uncharacterized protein n=1 Tax=Trichonephila clavipes TaxID=2585209 RepID=A0A8X6VY39_TRICX|nr:hypothetical protein TNCV_1016151 [Trichonephila clavipes]
MRKLCEFSHRKILHCILGGIQANGSWRRRSNLEPYKIYDQPDIVKFFKLQRLKWAGHLVAARKSLWQYPWEIDLGADSVKTD